MIQENEISKIDWKKAKGIENLNLPNALSRFEDNKDIINVGYNDLGLVIPSPKKIILENTKIYFFDNPKKHFFRH